MPADPPHPFVGRGGIKLRHALDTFAVDITGLTCADFGCSTGGFTDCLLQAGAAMVHAIDTAYGQLAWKLRTDARVVVTERTSALHADPPPDGVDLVVCDMGWTPQRLIIPAALRWLRPSGRIISLIKPHYELKDRDAASLPHGAVLDETTARAVVDRVVAELPSLGVHVLGVTRSPILGGASRKHAPRGNPEWLVILVPAPA